MTWLDETRDGVRVMRPAPTTGRLVVAFSGRGHAPDGEAQPTPYLARRFAKALGLDGTPIHWARQVHGAAAATLRESVPAASAPCAGECDALATDQPGTALVVQTADCVPILLAAPDAVGAAHAGWRGTAKNVAGAAVAALTALGARPSTLSAWLGPSIGPCCYEVGGDVAAQFAGDFVRAGCGGGFRLDLRAVNVAQLAAAGIPREAIAVHPACTKCGGDGFASYRRDGAKAGRMIALIARV
ncbi:MAG TPA: peptidoglycan editing factor PgeF [Thermoanaerobaculia bacterium]|nr:peptidoglycan editing factor PgeF [Thermoanaerobaculia bacterium]